MEHLESDSSASLPAVPPHEPLLYRPNVAAILTRPDGCVLVAERLRFRGAWQFPQGGVDDGESPEEALFREVREEIGVEQRLIRIITKRGGYRYAFPKGRLKYGIYGGQEQTYFLCQFLGTDSDINLTTDHQEFGAWKWILPHEFDMNWLPRFKQRVYRAVLRDFFDIEL